MIIKKILAGLVLCLFVTSAFADNAANIVLRISGGTEDNRYFFCEPNIGCLSIRAAEYGAVYPIFHSFTFHNAYVTNLSNLRVSGQPLPDSCNVTVNTGQSIIVYGHIASAGNGNSYISGLYCSLR